MKIIDDSEWNNEQRIPSWEQYKSGDIETSDVFTIEELEKAVEEEQSQMSEDEKYFRYSLTVDPTYFEWVLSAVSRKIQPGQKIEIDERCKMYRIIED